MSDAKIAIKYVLENEGGFVNNPADKGGPTNFGLSQKFLESNCASKVGPFYQSSFSPEFIKNISEEAAIEVYEKIIWKPIYGEILSQDICNYYFDMVVNHGEIQATKMLQRSLWAAVPYTINPLLHPDKILDDGILGNLTINVTNYRQSPPIVAHPLLPILRATRAQYYHCLAKKAGQDQFLEGWLKRTYR